jgi:Cu(I)/Ag(I) efflux system membrane fusion protein/cobalt-zinc-cadmium efflux system membrane fusion protein
MNTEEKNGVDLKTQVARAFEPQKKSRKSRFAWAVPALLGAMLLGVLIGGPVASLFAGDDTKIEAVAGDEQKTKYTCGMHPHIVQNEPGYCPVCEMKLTPLKPQKTKKKIVTGEVACKGRQILHYQAPMDSAYRSPTPGKSPMGMDLVPACESDEEASVEGISVDSRIRQNMGIRMDFTGQKVSKGQRLLSIYSPKLISTQEDLLLALRQYRANQTDRNKILLKAAERRLQYWDISMTQIKRIKESGEVQRALNIYSPMNGVVVHKNVFKGKYVKAGMDLFRIANLSRVWVYVHIYEMDVPFVKVGQVVEVDLPYAPGIEVPQGRVDYVFPWLDRKTRDVKARLVFDNRDGNLKPDMYASVVVHADLGREALLIDNAAVIRSGVRNVVFVETGPGTYESRSVRLGVELDDTVEIIEGVGEGEQVVVNGQFMLDSESRLKEALQKYEKGEP